MEYNEKKLLVEQCRAEIDSRIKEIEEQLRTLKDDVAGESKSSAGDKHETARAMMNLEQEKLSQQQHEMLKMQEKLQHIDFGRTSDDVRLGSLVTTNQGKFIVSVPLGKITFEGREYLFLSAQSPLGNLLLGKAINDTITVGKMEYAIHKIE